jgi:exonuclease VII large subunit
MDRYRHHSVEQKINEQLALIEQLRHRYEQSVRYKLDHSSSQLEPLNARLTQAEQLLLNQKAALLQSLFSNLRTLDPKLKDKKGFAQVVKEGRPVSLGELCEGDEIRLMDSRLTAVAEIRSISENAGKVDDTIL